MPQEFRVVRCYQCDVFQVQMVKKSNKWKCVICGNNQSIKKVYGTGTGKECRLHVQKLNELRMKKDLNASNTGHDNSFIAENDSFEGLTQAQENISQKNNDNSESSQLNDNSQKNVPLKINTTGCSKWAKYLENEPKHPEADSCSEDLFNGVKCVLELPSNKKARKTLNSNFNKNVKKFKGRSESPNMDIDHFQKENDNIQNSCGSDNEEYWDTFTKVNDCMEEISDNQFDYNESGDIKPEVTDSENIILPSNTYNETSKWSIYVTDVDIPNSHKNSNLVNILSSSSVVYHGSNIIPNKNMEFENKMVGSTSKWMKYIEAPIETDGNIIKNYATKQNKGLHENEIKTSKWGKYLDAPDSVLKSAVDCESNPYNEGECLYSKDTDSMECKVLKKSNLASHVENSEPLNVEPKTDIKSALSKFKMDKANLKTKITKHSSSCSTENLTKSKNSNYVFDSFFNSDNADLENIFDV